MNTASSTDGSESLQYQLAQKFHRALTTKDWSLLRTIMSPEVAWVLPGENAISGEARGIDAVIERADLIASYGLTFTLKHILVSRDNMALSLHNTATRSDAVLDEHLSTVCRLHEDRIVSVETYLSDVAGMNAFFVNVAHGA